MTIYRGDISDSKEAQAKFLKTAKTLQLDGSIEDISLNNSGRFIVTHKAEKLRVRQPLRSLTVATAEPSGLAPFRPLIAGEVNVKEVRILDAADAGYEVVQELSLNPRAFDLAVRRLTSRLFAAVKAGE